jgi:amino acid transporter
MTILDVLFGRPLANSEERAEHIGPLAGIPIFGLDALSSSAYGPEAALTLLIPLGGMGVHYIVPLVMSILALLFIVYFSYCQTIEAYPKGGGSYTVASENLGEKTGLLAAAALMIDYVLTAAVGISAGVGALISALPQLQPHTLLLCLAILAILTLINLRGVRDTGVAFMIPTYLFVGTLFTVLALGTVHVLATRGHPIPAVAIPKPLPVTGTVTLWLLLKAFSSGCTAMTGVEAVSNGVMAFREPRRKQATQTLSIIILLLMMLLAGIAFLCRAYEIGATVPNSSSYQSVLSQLTEAVMGRGIFYYVTIGSILLVLALSANTAFADFPRLTRAIALNNHLPHIFIARGRRLLYSNGIFMLVALTAVLLILFDGVTDRLIPLFAVGAFLAFTLSQAGMVMHWKRHGGRRAFGHMFVNGLGALATGITVLVVLVAKFVEGAWVTAILIPSLVGLMILVRRYYVRVSAEIAKQEPLSLQNMTVPLVVMPIDRWSRLTEKGLRFGLILGGEITAVHVDLVDEKTNIDDTWEQQVAIPLRAANLPVPALVRLKSPYRQIISPIVDYVLDVERRNPDRKIVVIVPELVVRKWYQTLLHNQRANLLRLMLLLRGNERIIVVNIPWYLGESKPEETRSTTPEAAPSVKHKVFS